MKNRTKLRTVYLTAAAVLFAAEVLIALFVHDAFMRPYGGDVLVVILLCCAVRVILPEKARLLPLWVFVFAVAVELSQSLPLVDVIGLGESRFFRILLGTSFSFVDLVCYAVGCLAVFAAESIWHPCFRQGR